MRKALVGLAKFGFVLVLLAVAGAFTVNLLSVSSVEFTVVGVNPNIIQAPDANELVNFTINNTNLTHSIINVSITMPGGFAFIQTSNGSSVASTTFTNTTTVLSWLNTSATGIINFSLPASFWFNVSVPNWAATYTFSVLAWYNNTDAPQALRTNTTTSQLNITMPIQLGITEVGGGAQINTTNTTDIFFTNNTWVPIIVNYTNNKGPLDNLTVTGNFSAIGASSSVAAVNRGGGLYQINATVNFSAITMSSPIGGAGAITITANNGSGTDTQTVQNVILVNMSIMPSCPPDPTQIPPFIPYGGEMKTVINCTQSNQNPCTLTQQPFYQWNSTHVVLCGPAWGSQTTNFNTIAATGNFYNFNLVLDIPGKAMINISGVNFSSQQMAGAIMEFAMKNLMSGGRVGINDSEWNGQNNRPNLSVGARLTLYNVSNSLGTQAAFIRFGNYSGMDNPTAQGVCTPARCPYVTYSNGNITFDVSTFSTYVIANESHVLNWTNLSGAISRTVVTRQNASYLINITNRGNLTGAVTYNITVVGNGTTLNATVTLNSTQYTSTGTSGVIELNVSNATAGTYTSYIIARYWNGTGTSSWNLSSETDGITLTTTVQTPTVTIVLPANNSNVSITGATIKLNITTNTNLQVCNYTINSTTNISLASCANTTLGTGNFTEGRQNVTVFVNDTYGNSDGNLTIRYMSSFIADSSTPKVGIITTNYANLSGSSYSVNASANDSISGVYSVELNLSNSSGRLLLVNMTRYSGNLTEGLYSYALNTTNYSDGRYNISIVATDYAGITNTTQLINVTIDNSAPAVTLNNPTANMYVNANFVVNATVTESLTNVDTVLVNLSNSSGQVNLTQLARENISNNNYNITLYIASYAAGNYTLRILANNTAAVTNNSISVNIVIDANGPGLSSWNYTFTTKQLTLVFNETIAISSIDLTKFNITDNGGYNVLAGLTGATVATTANTTTVLINFTTAMDSVMRNLGSEGQMDMAAGAVTDLGGANAVAKANLAISAYTRYGIDIDLTGSIWNSFNLPRNVLENRSSLGSNYTVAKVLESVWGNFAITYYYNTTDWTSNRPGSGAGQTFANFTDNTGTNSYWLYMTTADRLQIV